MKVLDAFAFAGELDLLECRLIELDSVVDRWIIAEADTTFSGNRKDVVLGDHKERFAAWWDRITWLIVDDMPAGENAWVRENHQRDALVRGLNGIRDADIFILSDVDEIPTVSAVECAKSATKYGVVTFEQVMHPFAVDWLYPLPWPGPVACRGKHLRSISLLRYCRGRGEFGLIKDGGRHLTWLGDPNTTEEKLRSFSHTDFVPTVLEFGLERFRKEGRHVDGALLEPVDVDETWPAFIVERRCPEVWFRPR